MLMYHAPDREYGTGTTRSQPSFDVRLLIAPIIAAVLTIWIDPSYTGGDPSLYRYFYDAVGTETLSHGFFFYSVVLSSTEPFYYLMIWLLSHLGVPREVFIGASSFMMAYLAARIMKERGSSPLVYTAIIGSSFYFILLYTTTERLKIALIFLLASLLLSHKPKIAVFLSLVAIASHIQVAILYISLAAIYALSQLDNKKSSESAILRLIGTLLIAVVVSMAAYYLVGSQIASKSIVYSGLGQQVDLLRVLPFYFASLWYTKRRMIVTLLFIPLIILTPIVGYGRLNIFSYMILIYFSVQKNRGFNVAIVISTIYFAFSSYAFITRIRDFGEPLLVGQ